LNDPDRHNECARVCAALPRVRKRDLILSRHRLPSNDWRRKLPTNTGDE
jgi:hypothetical protein